MKSRNIETSDETQLRLAADARMIGGTAPPNRGWTLSGDVLGLLYRLASDPESASDALKLLHELQLHQVELDMQQAQLEDNERAFAEDLAHYKAVYDFAPVGYFVLCPEGQIIEGNLASARLFGVDPHGFQNQSVGSFLAPQSRPVMVEMLKGLREDGSSASCVVQPLQGANSSRRFRATANRSPSGNAILMAISEFDLPQAT
ncbi:MAG: PAS domain-containing protein [Thioalkalivibrio sp.]